MWGEALYKQRNLETPGLVKIQVPEANLKSDTNPRATQELNSHRSLDQNDWAVWCSGSEGRGSHSSPCLSLASETCLATTRWSGRPTTQSQYPGWGAVTAPCLPQGNWSVEFTWPPFPKELLRTLLSTCPVTSTSQTFVLFNYKKRCFLLFLIMTCIFKVLYSIDIIIPMCLY